MRAGGTIKTQADLHCENFDAYFISEVEKLSPEERGLLPRDILSNLFSIRDGSVKPSFIKRYSTLIKIFILWRCCKKNWTLIIEDKEKGITTNQYQIHREKKRKITNYPMEVAEGLISTGDFVLGGRELCDSMNYLNELSCGSSYHYLIGAKNVGKSGESQRRDYMNYVAKMITFYEGNKKKWVASTGISIAEFFVLISLYHGEWASSSRIYKEVYRYSYNCSDTNIRRAYSSLQKKSFLIKNKWKVQSMIKITPLGVDAVNQIFSKYIVAV